MKRALLLGAAALLFVGSTLADSARAIECNSGCACASCCARSWHGGYYNIAWGSPVALVVPPTAGLQTELGWGIGGNRVLPIYSQYQQNWPGPAEGGAANFRPTPAWPSDTRQFGIYYIRGPW